MLKLSERAVLVTLHTGCWSGALVDRKVTEEVNTSYQAERDAGRYNKQIVAFKFIRHVESKVREARDLHKLLTLPWQEGGTRIISNIGYLDYIKNMRLRKVAVEASALEFVKDLPQYITEAKARLGGMFNKEDYPNGESLVARFYVDVETRPVAEAEDFRTKLSEAAVKAVTKEIEQRNNQRIEAAVNNIYSRVAEVTGKMAERLKAYEPAKDGERAKGGFHDSLVYNIKELADLMPALNITGDAGLDALAKRLNEELVEQYSPEILKADAKARAITANKADKIFKKVSQYLS